MTLKKIIIQASLVIALLISLLVCGVYFIDQQQIISQRQQNLQSIVKTMTGSISNEMQGLVQWVETVATDPLVINALHADENVHEQTEQQLGSLIPGLLRLRLLTPDVNEVDESEIPPLGYADLELIQTAQSENPQPVIIKMKLPGAHIAIARAVYQDEQIAGTVLASFSTDRLKQFINVLLEQDGTIALFQEGKSLVNSGDASVMASEPDGVSPVAGTPWEIRYWTGMPDGFSSILYAGIGLLSGLIILALLAMWLLRKLDFLFKEDISILKTVATDVCQGNTGKSYDVKFFMFDDLIKHFRLLNIREVSDRGPAIEVEITTEEEEERKLEERGNELIRDLDQQFAEVDALMGELENEDLGIHADSSASGEVDVLSPGIIENFTTRPLTTGIYGTIGKEFDHNFLNDFGRALGTELVEAGMTKIVIASNHDEPGSKVLQSISAGLLTAGSKLLDLKQVVSPVVAFSTQFPKDSIGVVVSDSYFTKKTCKIKLLYSGGYVSTILLERIKQRMKAGSYIDGLGVSASSDKSPEAEYIGAIVEDIHIHYNIKIAVVSASKLVRNLAHDLFQALGCDVVKILTPELSNHSKGALFDLSDPTHLQQLCEVVRSEQADLGLAYDTEGSAMAIVDSSGHIVWSDRVMMALSADVLQTFPGADILFDIEGSSDLARVVTKNSGKLITKSTGENVFCHLTSTNMPLAGNMNGQYVFADRWMHYPDALYASSRLLEILSVEDQSSHEFFSEWPDYCVGIKPFLCKLKESEAPGLLKKWGGSLEQSNYAVIVTESLLRAEAGKTGLAIVRYSKYQGGIVFRFQAKTETGIQSLMKLFKKLASDTPNLDLPF